MAKTEEPIVTEPNREDTEETIVTEPNREDEVLKLGKTFKRACLLNWFQLVCCVSQFVASLSLICKYADSNVPKEQILLYSLFVPYFVLAVNDIFCTSYYVFALTQTTVRHLYVAVFHINIFNLFVGLLGCIYYFMLFYSPYHFYNLLVLTSFLGRPSILPTFDLRDIYRRDLTVILVLCTINYAFLITLTCAIYFKAHKLRIFLSKYWFLKTLLVLALDLFFVHYYIYLLFLKYDNGVLAHLLLFLAKTIIVIWYLKKQVCVPNSFKLKPLDGKMVPDNTKLKQAMRIMEMKAEMKEVANSGRSEPPPC